MGFPGRKGNAAEMIERGMEIHGPVSCLEQIVTLANNHTCGKCYEQQRQEKNLAM